MAAQHISVETSDIVGITNHIDPVRRDIRQSFRDCVTTFINTADPDDTSGYEAGPEPGSIWIPLDLDTTTLEQLTNFAEHIGRPVEDIAVTALRATIWVTAQDNPTLRTPIADRQTG